MNIVTNKVLTFLSQGFHFLFFALNAPALMNLSPLLLSFVVGFFITTLPLSPPLRYNECSVYHIRCMENYCQLVCSNFELWQEKCSTGNPRQKPAVANLSLSKRQTKNKAKNKTSVKSRECLVNPFLRIFLARMYCLAQRDGLLFVTKSQSKRGNTRDMKCTLHHRMQCYHAYTLHSSKYIYMVFSGFHLRYDMRLRPRPTTHCFVTIRAAGSRKPKKGFLNQLKT